MLKYIIISCILFALVACQNREQLQLPTATADLASIPIEEASQTWPVLSSLGAPQGLRACCAFGYNIRAEISGVPVPFYLIDNIVEANKLGEHHYNDSYLAATADIVGLNSEKVGLVYTTDGGFIDIAHVRDTADYTLYLFSQIYPNLGKEWTLKLSDELASRQIHFNSFTPPESAVERYTLSTYLAAKLAFQLAAWHEIAQWYGYQSVPGFSEGVSAFSPEDLYSNLLGARLASSLILQGRAESLTIFSHSLETILPVALNELGAFNKEKTREVFDRVDGIWWDSSKRVPNKFLLLTRDYDVADSRYPFLPTQTIPHKGLKLSLPDEYAGYSLAKLAQFRLVPTDKMAQLPVPEKYWTIDDFSTLAEQAKIEDQKQQTRTLKK
ncbi:DUF4056 domain-containing protein [Providencia rustigianii]|uniref:DUF4056 domain-containing protein n=1 Tax=Providencia rustigianii TaxID=158850 RepID=UPI000F6BAC1E|nr:DUF4056 domain-containing protein [Providencia rustigianii]MTC59798.1 DUF4056 domain-containing protein [Providencia rustigianii]VEH53644.1 Uncharacterised protein [Providencia rustigianii]